MNFIEAIKLLNQGYKVTKDSWDKEDYICLKGCLVFDEKEEVYDFIFDDYLHNNWKIYLKERKLHTFEKALSALKNGKTVRRKSDDSLLSLVDGRFVEEREGGRLFPVYFYEPSDLLAKDWIIIGE